MLLQVLITIKGEDDHSFSVSGWLEEVSVMNWEKAQKLKRHKNFVHYTLWL